MAPVFPPHLFSGPGDTLDSRAGQREGFKSLGCEECQSSVLWQFCATLLGNSEGQQRSSEVPEGIEAESAFSLVLNLS